MNRTIRNTEHRQNNSNKVNYAQAAGSVSGSQHQPTRSHHYSQYNAQQETEGAEQQIPYHRNYRPNNNNNNNNNNNMTHTSYHTHRNNSYHHNNKFNNGYTNRKPSTPLPIQPSTENSHQAQQRPDMIPRPHRNSSQNKLFAASFAPRQEFHPNSNYNHNQNQTEQPHHTNYNANNNVTNNSHRYFNNYHNSADNNGVNNHSTYRQQQSPGNNNTNSQQPYISHQSTQQQPSVQYSPQLPDQSPQQQTLPSSATINHRTTSPNLSSFNPPKKNGPSANFSPHNTQQATPPSNIPMTANWPPVGQYYFPAQYSMPMPYMIPQPPPHTVGPPMLAVPSQARKVITIINPETGTVVDTSSSFVARRRNSNSSTTSTNSTKPSPQPLKAKPDFVKPSHVSKRIEIVDPAIRDRLIREKKEREEAEKEARQKAEEEAREAERKAEQERLEAERKAEQERLEAERKAEEERLEAERKAEEERLEAERKAEEERLEAERKAEEERKEAERKRLAEEAAAAAAAALEKQKQEDEARRKEEEERESRRVIHELEAEKRKQEELRAHKVGRVPSPLITHDSLVTDSPLASPTVINKAPPIQATLIDDFSKITYPEGITGPNITDKKKLMYSTNFMMQFRPVCLDTDFDLSVIRESLEQSNNSRANFQRQNSDRGNRAPRTPSGMNNDNNMFRMGSRDGRMEMGKFNMGRPLTVRNNSTQNMERQGSRGGGMSNRGGGRGGSNFGGMKIIRNPPQQHNAPASPGAPLDDLPLPKSENRWVPVSALKKAEAPKEGELMSQEYITRKVNALLNKLTLEKFDSIAGQIFEYAKQSAKEEDGRSLRTVIKLAFEKACDEPAFASMWARLCRYMLDNMTDDIKDTSILDNEGKPTSGVLLFRKYLFNRCQSEFEKGWKVNMPVVDEATMLTDEYYAAAKAKRQGLGLIQFIGELFKLDMLSERIMYSCMIKLCNDPQNAGDEEAESLCKLLTTIGQVLDKKPKTAKWVDIVMTRMKNEMSSSPKLTSRVKFMIQDVLDLRRDKWVPRIANKQIGPTTIAKIHEQAEKDKEIKEAAAATKRNTSSRGHFIPNANQYNSHNNHPVSRTGSFRGGFSSPSSSGANQIHNSHNGNLNIGNTNNVTVSSDDWNTVSQGANKSRATDLSNFGKMDRSRPRTNILGPSNSPFPSLSRGKSGVKLDTKASADSGRASPATNMFSALSSTGEKSTTEDRKPLDLLPKSADATANNATLSPASSPQLTSDKPKLSDEAVKRKCKNILEEYFSINDKQELSECVKELDCPHYLILLVGQMLTVVEKKAQDVEKMCDTITYLRSQNLISKEHFIGAFTSFMEGYDDLTIDVPQAPKFVAQLLKACELTPEEVNGSAFESLKNAFHTS